MRTALRVHALICQAQPLHRPPAYKMFFHNLCRVLWPHMAIPNRFRINHHRRPVLALVQTAGFIDAHAARQSCGFRQLLQLRMQVALSVAGTRRARRTFGAHVVANKDVAFKWGQSTILLNPDNSRLPRFHSRCIPKPRRGVAFSFKKKPS